MERPSLRVTGPNAPTPSVRLAGSTSATSRQSPRRPLTRSPGHEIGDLVGGSGLEDAYEERLAGTPDLVLRVVNARGKSRLELDESVRHFRQERQGDTRHACAASDVERLWIDRRRCRRARPQDRGHPRGRDLLRDRSQRLRRDDRVRTVQSCALGHLPAGIGHEGRDGGGGARYRRRQAEHHADGSRRVSRRQELRVGCLSKPRFRNGVRNSVNTAFAQVALDLGAKRLTRYAELFGFNAKPAMPLDAAKPSFPFPEDPGDLMWGSIGQAQDIAAPLQMATVAATVANGGKRMEPRSSLRDPKQGTRVLKRSTANELAVLMESAVNSGTGTAARIDGVRVAGKTGTAEVDVGGKIRNHAWFITFAPIDSPQVAIAVVSEFGGIGGQVAAPIARNIYAGVLPLT